MPRKEENDPLRALRDVVWEHRAVLRGSLGVGGQMTIADPPLRGAISEILAMLDKCRPD
jgi:hypothetical protein